MLINLSPVATQLSKALEQHVEAVSTGAAMSVDSAAMKAASPLMAPLPEKLWQLGDDITPESKAAWQGYLKATGGKPALVPIGTFDPSKKMVVLVPGTGMNFQDLHALQGLQNQYQLVVVVADISKMGSENIPNVSDALKKLIDYRNTLAAGRGLPPDATLRLVGHSYGSYLGPSALTDMNARGLLNPNVKHRFIGLDGPWAGQDVPWFFTLPGVRWVMKKLIFLIGKDLPGNKPLGGLSLINRTPNMDAFRAMILPKNVKVDLVTIHSEAETAALATKKGPFANFQRHFPDAVTLWHSHELGVGDLNQIWNFLRTTDKPLTSLTLEDLNKMDTWVYGGTFRKQRVGNLMRGLMRDKDFAAHAEELRNAARNSPSPEAFAPKWDTLIETIATAFRGQHTQAMWTDPTFMPWLRGALANGA
jgi:hypothetical protein